MLRHLPFSSRETTRSTTNIHIEHLFNALRDCLHRLQASFLFIFEIIQLPYETRLSVSCAQRTDRKRRGTPKVSLEHDLAQCLIELKSCIKYLREVLIAFNLLRLTPKAKHRVKFHLSQRTIQRNQYIQLVENVRFLTEQATKIPSDLFQYLVIRISRFKQYSVAQQQQQEDNETNDTDTNLAFTIPREYITDKNLPSGSLFHGGTDSPSLNAVDPLLGQHVHITKYLCLKSKSSTQQYVNHLYERIRLTSDLSHPNVRRIISWYIADGCLYSITGLIHCTLRHAIQSERFSIERIQRLSSQIIQGTIYLQSNGLCPLTPWYTTNIELTSEDRIRLCSPTIASTKLNGGVVQHHHLWRHAPESLIRMITGTESGLNGSSNDSKEDVWSIGCIMVEMMINTILFHPQNDDPALQLFCIVQFVGGLTGSVVDGFPLHVKQLFSTIKCDIHQQRLHRLLNQIFHHYRLFFTKQQQQLDNHLYNLLTQLFQFQPEKRFSLQSSIEHPFFGIHPIKSSIANLSLEPRIGVVRLPKAPIRMDDLIHLCTKLNLEHGRWVPTLKERCLLELILQVKTFSQVNLAHYGLSRLLQVELRKLIEFLTGNQ